MPYATYYIHTQSLNMNIRDFYQKYDVAIKRLKMDTEEFIKTSRNINSVDYITKKNELMTNKKDGYYLKHSNKYANRIAIYEKSSKDIGYFMSNIITVIKKIYVFSLIELSIVPETINLDINVAEVSRKVFPKIEMVYLDELKTKIKDRKYKYD